MVQGYFSSRSNGTSDGGLGLRLITGSSKEREQKLIRESGFYKTIAQGDEIAL